MSDISITCVLTDGGTQARDGLNPDTVQEYAAAMERGDEFPPVVAFYDGTDYWMGDGFHRSAAAEQSNREVPVEVRPGTRRDAILYAVGANSDHGLPRTNADKRRAVMTMLEDPEWSQWSNREIARRCRVDKNTVAKWRDRLSGDFTRCEPPRKAKRNGKEYTVDTSNIGKRIPEDDEPKSKPPAKPDKPASTNDKKKITRPCMGKTAARSSIHWLKQVTKLDQERKECFQMMRDFMKTREGW